jgi:hypothetical protein
MVGMPYLLLGTVGYLIYRAHTKRPADRPSEPPLPSGTGRASDEQGVRSCSLPSAAGTSSPAP